MGVFEERISHFFKSSGEGVQRIQKDGVDLGNEFRVTLRTPLSIPSIAQFATLEVVSAQVWNTSPNISALNGNNHFYINDEDIVIIDGLYGVSELNNYLQQKFEEVGLSQDILTLSGDSSTQKIVITFKENCSIEFKPNSIATVLGFDTEIPNPEYDPENPDDAPKMIPRPPVSGEAEDNLYGDKVAAFNRISSYFIQTNMVSEGIPTNASSPGLIASIPINVPVGSLINYNAVNPLPCSLEKLINNSIQNISFTLLDQDLRPVSTASEDWSFSILIRYYYNDIKFDKRFKPTYSNNFGNPQNPF